MGDWSTFSSLENPDLVCLASSLPDIALRARAPSTVASYIRAFQLWATWASSYDLASLPADTSHICLCFAYLIQSARTCSPVISAAAAQSWANEKAGSPDPVQASIVQQVLKGARRTLAKPRLKKNPIKVDDIRKLLQHWNGPDASLMNIQAIILIVLGFTTFLRWDELSRMTIDQLTTHPTHASIFVESRKNDPLVTRTGSANCPVALLEKFLAMGLHASGQHLFCKIGTSNAGQTLRNVPMTYLRVRELLRMYFQKVGVDGSDIALHSLRSGGASAAANAGVSDRLFKRHGVGRLTPRRMAM